MDELGERRKVHTQGLTTNCVLQKKEEGGGLKERESQRVASFASSLAPTRMAKKKLTILSVRAKL